jgi:fibronectin-binding autotransporter adhesin
LFGYDRKVSDGATVGVFGGYAEPRYNQDAATSSARTKTYQLGGYGRLNSGAWHVDGAVSYARNSTDTSRVVTVGALNRVAAGSFKGDTVAVHVETGYTIKASGFEVQPLAALSWVRQTQNAYSETGAGALNLLLPDQHQQSLRSTLGLRSLIPFQAGGTTAVFEARAAWAHEFNNTRSINARLAGDPAASVFTVSGPSLPRDTAVVGVGIAAQASRNLRLYADVNGEFNGSERAGTLSVGLRYQW